ncbi:MAG TPA: methyltransferase domain-containing protein [Elusimicrobiota bacterium]|jgi:SAM-dependent methyltransferase|nr:methyltransferase domain-containing protein [Elusimicrobiota bacterium]
MRRLFAGALAVLVAANARDVQAATLTRQPSAGRPPVQGPAAIAELKGALDLAIGAPSLAAPETLPADAPALSRAALQYAELPALYTALESSLAQAAAPPAREDAPAPAPLGAGARAGKPRENPAEAPSRFRPLPLVASVVQQLGARQGPPLASLGLTEIAELSARLLKAYDNAAAISESHAGVVQAAGLMEATEPPVLGDCGRNILRLLQLLQSDRAGFDLGRARVLFLTRPAEYQFGDPLEPNLALLGIRKEGSEAATFHIVLEYEGRIYDLSSEKGRHGMPAREYFDQTLLLRPKRAIEVDPGRSGPMQERLRLQIARHAFRDRQTLYSQVRVRPIGAREYLSRYYQEIAKNPGSLGYFWDELEKELPSVNLGHYLDPGSKALPYAKLPRPDWDRKRTVSFGDTRVSFNENALMVGDLSQVGNAVTVKRLNQRYAEKYNRTDRGLEVMPWLFPARMMDLKKMRGMVVLDATAGGGLLVEELREKGVPAYGIDIALNKRQRKSMLADTRKLKSNGIILPKSLAAKPFLWGSAETTRIADAQVDAIYDTQGIFAYEFFGDQAFVRRVVEEWRRILKVGGVIRFAPIDESYERRVRDFFAAIPGLAVTDFAPPAKGDEFARAVEITRVY